MEPIEEESKIKAIIDLPNGKTASIIVPDTTDTGVIVQGASALAAYELVPESLEVIKKKVNSEKELHHIKVSVSELSLEIDKGSPQQEITEIWKLPMTTS